MTDDTLKAEVSRIVETLFRRIEFDGSLHKSSLEDELYRWAKDVLGKREPKDIDWEHYDRLYKREEKKALVAEAAKTMQRLAEPPTYTHSMIDIGIGKVRYTSLQKEQS